jgi:surface antigen
MSGAPCLVMTKRLLTIGAVAVVSACVVPGREQPSQLPALSETAQNRRFTAFQDAMEQSQGDRSVRWQVSNEVFGRITPIDTLASKSDGWCRSYEEIIANGVRQFRLVGIACRSGPRRWLVMDVRSFERSL